MATSLELFNNIKGLSKLGGLGQARNTGIQLVPGRRAPGFRLSRKNYPQRGGVLTVC